MIDPSTENHGRSGQDRYVTAAGHPALTGLYDPFMALTMREDTWRPALRANLLANLPEGGRIADVGCGTGTLSIDLANSNPNIEIVGVDGDLDALSRAQAKPDARRVRWVHGFAGDLPLENGSVDSLVMTLLLHHLDPDEKHRALTEAHRVMRPGGLLHIADWGRPQGLFAARFLALRILDGFPNTRDHAEGRIPEFIEDSGFDNVRCYRRLPTVWGTLELLYAHRRSD
jgi:ubiquinone/menaquinone biosynthesis C-methylase UbiE